MSAVGPTAAGRGRRDRRARARNRDRRRRRVGWPQRPLSRCRAGGVASVLARGVRATAPVGPRTTRRSSPLRRRSRSRQAAARAAGRAAVHGLARRRERCQRARDGLGRRCARLLELHQRLAGRRSRARRWRARVAAIRRRWSRPPRRAGPTPRSRPPSALRVDDRRRPARAGLARAQAVLAGQASCGCSGST